MKNDKKSKSSLALELFYDIYIDALICLKFFKMIVPK